MGKFLFDSRFMHMSLETHVVEITEDTFLKLARTTIVASGLTCEGSKDRECDAVLSCWHSYSCVSSIRST